MTVIATVVATAVSVGGVFVWVSGFMRRPRVEIVDCTLSVREIDAVRRGWSIDAVLINKGRESDELIFTGFCPRGTKESNLSEYPRYAPYGHLRIPLPPRVPIQNHAEIHDSPGFLPSEPFSGQVYYQFSRAGTKKPLYKVTNYHEWNP